MSGEPALSGLHPTPDTGVILLQMGGPSSLEEVRPFIRKVLSDPSVVSAPKAVRIPLALLVSLVRAPGVRRHYEAIGGGSPITTISMAQAARLQEALEAMGRPLPVILGQRYSAPEISESLEQACQMGLSKLVLVPLYPQFSYTTTGSALKEVERLCPTQRVLAIKDYADHPAYVKAVAETVREAISRLSEAGRSSFRILFSAHAIPMRYVLKGDPYPERVMATVEKVVMRLDTEVDYRVCFQSRIRPVKWLGPSAEQMLKEAKAQGKQAVVMVPISFVSDHLETLYEMDVIYKRKALAYGIREFVRARSLNDSVLFTTALAQIVLAALENARFVRPWPGLLSGWP